MSTGFEEFKQLLTTTGREPARSNLYGVDIFMPPVLAANDPTLRRDQRGVYDAMNYLADTVTLPGRRVTTSQSKTNAIRSKWRTVCRTIIIYQTRKLCSIT